MGRFWAWLTTDKSSVNGQSPAPPPPPDVPRIEPRMATDLGEALTAYWHNRHWLGMDGFIKWLYDTGQISEARFALKEIKKMPDPPASLLKRLRPIEKLLEARLHEQLPLPPPDSHARGDLADAAGIP